MSGRWRGYHTFKGSAVGVENGCYQMVVFEVEVVGIKMKLVSRCLGASRVSLY